MKNQERKGEKEMKKKARKEVPAVAVNEKVCSTCNCVDRLDCRFILFKFKIFVNINSQ